MSPLTHAGKDAAPALIVHGDRDAVVPIGQSRAMGAKLKRRGVACELKVAAGKEHFGPWILPEVPALADRLDAHLRPKK